MNFRPLHDRVLLRREEEGRRAGGIMIPDTAKEKSILGGSDILARIETA